MWARNPNEKPFQLLNLLVPCQQWRRPLHKFGLVTLGTGIKPTRPQCFRKCFKRAQASNVRRSRNPRIEIGRREIESSLYFAMELSAGPWLKICHSRIKTWKTPQCDRNEDAAVGSRSWLEWKHALSYPELVEVMVAPGSFECLQLNSRRLCLTAQRHVQ